MALRMRGTHAITLTAADAIIKVYQKNNPTYPLVVYTHIQDKMTKNTKDRKIHPRTRAKKIYQEENEHHSMSDL